LEHEKIKLRLSKIEKKEDCPVEIRSTDVHKKLRLRGSLAWSGFPVVPVRPRNAWVDEKVH
jgi:hypothetical protein